MQKSIRMKQVGDKLWQDAVLSLPEIGSCLDPYTIDIVEYPLYSIGMIFLCQKDEDIYQFKYNLNYPDNIKDCMRTVIQTISTDIAS